MSRQRPPTGGDLAEWCLERLAEREAAARTDPLANPARQLAYELAEAEASRAIHQQDLDAAARRYGEEALAARADRFGAQHANAARLDPVAIGALYDVFAGLRFEDMRKAVERPRAGAVFTAHPTFALSQAKKCAFAARIGAEAAASSVAAEADHDALIAPTLAEEHAEAQSAILRAQASHRKAIRGVLVWAKRCFPAEWTTLVPAPVSLATWVGYDLDGRTDIHWSETFRIRIEEKASQLRRYVAELDAVRRKSAEIAALAESLAGAARLADEQAQLFSGDFTDPETVTRAANRLTGDDPHRMTSLADAGAVLGAAISGADDDTRLALAVLRAEMSAYGLGVARLHLRVNAAQVASALRAELGLDTERELLDRTVLETAAREAASATRRRVNFASIFHERMTARRQFMLCAEFLKHVDSDTPIRFLIAECEAPATVMGAVFLARIYGVAERVDICPLFETPDAIERGGRFIERLLMESEFVAYVRARGRIAIQAGFSDSGRFMGQTAANLAIERLHILLARALARAGLNDIEAVVFNTHGESLGRGGFPGALSERLDYLMTPWARARFRREGMALCMEQSFQGGDGYLHFMTSKLSDATLGALLAWSLEDAAPDLADRYYRDINYSWDFYRALKAWQEALFADPDYAASILTFGPQLLVQSGSRKLRRQSDASADLRSLRAIPHNAILQQLAAPINVCGGVGGAAGVEASRLIDLAKGSPRIGQILRIAARARQLTLVSALRAYGALFDPAFWISKAAVASSPQLAERCARLARRLARAPTTGAVGRLADLIAGDLLKFDAVMSPLAAPPPHAADDRERRMLLALHAIRQALIMKAFLIVADLPAFSRRHDVSQSDLFDLAFELRFDDLAEQLNLIFPASRSDPAAFARLEEAGDEVGEGQKGYPEVQASSVAPLRAIAASLRAISIGVAQFYDAYG
jgi:phosphoenolpyruvate carboxylase